MAAHAASLLAPGTRALTHCNTGALATGGYGSALGRSAHGVRAGPARARARGRDAAAAPGRPPHRLGARGARHPAHRDRRLGRGAHDGARRGGLRRRRRRPDRRERRRGEQDRHVWARGARRPPRPPVLRRRADLDDRPGDADGRRDPARGAERRRGDGPIPGAQPRLRRHACGAGDGDRDRGGRASRAVRRDAAEAGAAREGAGPRRRLRDPALPAHARSCRSRCSRSPAARSWTTCSTALGAVEGLDEVFVVTNARFAAQFEEWASSRPGVTVLDDGTGSDDDKLGAIGDIAFTLERTGLDDDLLVVAGDNLFTAEIGDFAARRRRAASARARGPRRRRPRGDQALQRARARRRRPHRLLRGEAAAAALARSPASRSTSTPARRCRSSTATSPRATTRTPPDGSSSGSTRSFPSTRGSCPGCGSTSARTTGSRRPTAPSRPCPALRSSERAHPVSPRCAAPPARTRSGRECRRGHAFDAGPAHIRVARGRSVAGGARPRAPAALRRLRAAGPAALRGVPRRADPDRAARSARAAGRRAPGPSPAARVHRPPARLRARPGGDPLRRRRQGARLGLEGARPAPARR